MSDQEAEEYKKKQTKEKKAEISEETLEYIKRDIQMTEILTKLVRQGRFCNKRLNRNSIFKSKLPQPLDILIGKIHISEAIDPVTNDRSFQIFSKSKGCLMGNILWAAIDDDCGYFFNPLPNRVFRAKTLKDIAYVCERLMKK